MGMRDTSGMGVHGENSLVKTETVLCTLFIKVDLK